MKFVYNVIRPLWALPIKFAYFVRYSVVWMFSKKSRETYTVNKTAYNNIKTIDDLCNYFKNNYKYKYDGEFIAPFKALNGLLDHDNAEIEFFMAGADCDDMASYSCRKLKQLGYVASVVYLYNTDFKRISNQHLDCLFEKDGKYYFFNYGYLQEGNTPQECFNKVNEGYASIDINFSGFVKIN